MQCMSYYQTSLEISEIKVSLSSYCSFRMPSNRTSSSKALVKKKKQTKLKLKQDTCTQYGNDNYYYS